VAEGGPCVVGRPRRLVDAVDGNGEGDRGGGVDAAVRGAAVVGEADRGGGAAIGVQGRGEGQHARRRDGRLRGEEGVVVVRNVEVDALRRLVGRAGGDSRRPGRAVGAGVFEDGDVAAAVERRRVVDRRHGDGKGH